MHSLHYGLERNISRTRFQKWYVFEICAQVLLLFAAVKMQHVFKCPVTYPQHPSHWALLPLFITRLGSSATPAMPAILAIVVHVSTSFIDFSSDSMHPICTQMKL